MLDEIAARCGLASPSKTPAARWWQLVDSEGKPTDMKAAIAALDAKPKQRLTNKSTPNKAHNTSQVTPLARQVQSQSDKAALIDRLYGGKGSLESKLWSDA